MPVAMNRRRVSNFTYVSPCVKYMIFLLNFLFWLFGGLLVAAGTFAFYEKWNTMGSIKLNTFSDVILNISLVLIIAGQIIFIVSFAGCIGALRENTTLLKFLPFKNIAAQSAKICVSNVNVSQTSNFGPKNTDRLKKLNPMNNDTIIFKLLDRYDELLNIQAKSPIYTNSLKPTNESQLNFYKKYVVIDRDQILNLMYSTIEQANISAWRLHRQTRLSASSKAHQICTRRNRNEELAKRFIKDKKILGKGLKYVEYGIKMEDFASKKYSLVHNVHVMKCGLVVHQNQPWICASPDGLVINNNKVKKLLEIKCPYTCKDTLLIDEDNGKLRVPYLIYNEEKKTIDLKQNHIYFTQCQVQMYCTGMEECDLFVCTKADCITVNVKRDKVFLEKLIRKMEFFYFNYYLPELTKYSLCLLIFFLLEMGIAIIGFVFPHNMQATLEESFTDKIIHTYRDDPDLQNLIDFAQKEFQCCGLSSEGYIDWSKNEYFNCSSPSVEKCGVPYSCCINATDISKGLVNVMCGYGAQDSSVAEASKRVWTSGCIEVIRIWAERNLYTIAGVALGVALSQLLIINLAKTLEGQIDLQKSRWAS